MANNVNGGALFRNDRKTRENQPDHKGSVAVRCPHCEQTTDFWLSAWIKTAGASAKNPGSKFFSLALSEQDPKPTQQPTEQPNFDDDIPFSLPLTGTY